MRGVVVGFAFNDYCHKCQKVSEHGVEVNEKSLFGVCTACETKREIAQPRQVYYSKTDLWVTRFKIGNLQNVVTGKLLDAIKGMDAGSN